MKVFLYLSGLIFALTSGAAEQALTGVHVNAEPVKITRRTFDPQNPPADMPTLTPPEVGTCVYSFGCSTEVEMRGARGRPARVTGIRVRPQLTITLWTPREGPAKILAHEEGHRAICEVYYGQAEAIARRLAQRELGRVLTASVQDTAGTQAELKKIQDGLIAAFLRETATRCDFAQARFDAITAHSTNSVPESAAIVQAVAEEKAAYANGETAANESRSAGYAAPVRRAPTRPAR